MNVLLSVIVPIYNVETYLRKCIESIINQSYKNLDIILIDDGSTDGSGKICDEYKKIDSRVVVLHKKNGGVVSARKEGAKLAKGDYIISVDADDWIDVNRFEKLVKNGLCENPDMVYLDGTYREYSDRTDFSDCLSNIYGTFPIEKIWEEADKFLIRDDYFINRVTEFSHWSWCVKREIYVHNENMISDKIIRLEDVMMRIACLLESKKITYLREPSYHYLQQREGAINSRKNSFPSDYAKTYFYEMKKIIEKNKCVMNCTKENIISKYIYNCVMLTNYSVLYDYYEDYLFPYMPVRNGTKIIVYGAGNMGVEIVNAIDSNSRFELVAWVDKVKKINTRSNHKIDSLDIIDKIEFSYIVVAVINAITAKRIKEDLRCVVPEEKIILMDNENMSMQHLEKIFKN